MGFPRLSTFSSSVNCESASFHLRSLELHVDPMIATPFVNSLAQDGVLEYPLFGVSLTRDDGGTLALGMFGPISNYFGYSTWRAN